MMENMTLRTEVDILMATDLRFPGGNNASVVEEVRAQGRAGYTTALLHLPSPVQRSERAYAPRIRALIEGGDAVLVLGGSVRASVLVIRHPTVLMNLPADLPQLDVEHVVIVANQVPVDARARAPYYDVVACDRAAASLTGRVPQWAPIGPHVRTALEPFRDQIELRTYDWNNIIDVDSWSTPRSGFVANPPVIGRHSRGDWSKWPADRQTLTAIYPVDGSYTVKILGGTEAPAEILGGLPANWIDLPFNSVPPRHYLRGIDFLVYYHHPGLIEAFGRTVLEGIAAGAVAIVDPGFEEIFGSGALYAEPEQVRGVLDRYRNNLPAYLEQSDRGVQYARQHFGYGTHVERIRDIIGDPANRGNGAATVERRHPNDRVRTETTSDRDARVIVDLHGEFDGWADVSGPVIALVPHGVQVPEHIRVERIGQHVYGDPVVLQAYARARAAGLSEAFGDAAVLDVNARLRRAAGRSHRDLTKARATSGEQIIGEWATSVRRVAPGPASPGRASRALGVLRQRAPQWFVTLASAGKSAPRRARRRLLDAIAPAGAVLLKRGTYPRLRARGRGYGLFYSSGSAADADLACRAIAERAAMSNSFTPALLAPIDWAPAAARYGIPLETLLIEADVAALGGSWADYRRKRIAEAIELFQPISAANLGARGSLDDVIAALDIAENLGSRRSEKEG